jgi:hypothetical protein
MSYNSRLQPSSGIFWNRHRCSSERRRPFHIFPCVLLKRTDKAEALGPSHNSQKGATRERMYFAPREACPQNASGLSEESRLGVAIPESCCGRKSGGAGKQRGRRETRRAGDRRRGRARGPFVRCMCGPCRHSDRDDCRHNESHQSATKPRACLHELIWDSAVAAEDGPQLGSLGWSHFRAANRGSLVQPHRPLRSQHRRGHRQRREDRQKCLPPPLFDRSVRLVDS